MRLFIEVSFYQIANLWGLRLRTRAEIENSGPGIELEFLANFGLGSLRGS